MLRRKRPVPPYIIPGGSIEYFYVVFFTQRLMNQRGFQGIEVMRIDTSQELDETILRGQNLTQNLNAIPDEDLKNFVVINDGYSENHRVDLQQMEENVKRLQNMVAEPVYNLANSVSPLFMYRLERRLEVEVISYHDGKKHKAEKLSTFWTHEALDHDQEVPCARVDHNVVISAEEQCAYLFGGYTISQSQYNSSANDITKEKWFYYPVDDCWRLDLKILKWKKIIDLSRPIPNMVPSESDLSTYCIDLGATYDYRTGKLIGLCRRAEIKKAYHSVANLGYIIDTVGKTKSVYENLSTSQEFSQAALHLHTSHIDKFLILMRPTVMVAMFKRFYLDDGEGVFVYPDQIEISLNQRKFAPLIALPSWQKLFRLRDCWTIRYS